MVQQKFEFKIISFRFSTLTSTPAFSSLVPTSNKPQYSGMVSDFFVTMYPNMFHIFFC